MRMFRPALYGGIVVAVSLCATVVLAKPPPLGVALERQGYELITQRFGVKVYKHKTSSLINLAAEGVFTAPLDDVFATLLDYKSQVGNIARLSKSLVLLRTKRSLIVYQRLNLPVISDRDFTLRVWWGKDNAATRWIRYSSQRNGLGGLDGAVHVTHHTGSWQLRPIRGGSATFARFQVTIDMAGWLPRWMARSGAGKEVPTLYRSINKMLARRKRARRVACTSSRCS